MHDEPSGATPDDGELDALDGLVDRALSGEGHPTEPTDELTAAVLRVRALSEEPVPTASRDRHLATILTHGPAVAPPRRQPTRPRRVRRRLVAVTSAAALLLVSGGGAVAAAQDAQPDDALYGLKRTSEQVWLGVPRGSARAADVHLALAERRIDEARRAPDHAVRLVAEGLENVEAAAEERPEAAIESFERLLGDGPDRLPDQASPAARAALHRNCVRIAERRGLATDRCGEAPSAEHPGRGHGRGQGVGPAVPRGEGEGVGPGASRGQGEGKARGHARGTEDGPRGWGPGGRPEGAVGPPPGTPGHGRGGGNGAETDETDDAEG